MTRTVTERDFRMPEYRDADPNDYEFDGDGKPARKDRWERAVRSIAFRLGLAGRKSFEIPDVVAAVEALVESEGRWDEMDPKDRDTWPLEDHPYEVRLDDGSHLVGLSFRRAGLAWIWRGEELRLPVASFRDDLRKGDA